MRFRKIQWGSWWLLEELCEIPRCLLWRGLRHLVLCTMFLVSCIFFNKCLIFHVTWLDVLSYIPFILTLLRVFIINECRILSNAFSASIDMIMIFILHFVYMVYVYNVNWFIDLELTLHNRNKCHLIIVCDLLMYCWIQFANST